MDFLQGALQGRMGFCPVEYGFTALCQTVGFLVYGTFRGSKDEPAQSHVEHRTGGRADVARMLGPGEYDGYIAIWHSGTLRQRDAGRYQLMTGRWGVIPSGLTTLLKKLVRNAY
jgi:hypothetical protein